MGLEKRVQDTLSSAQSYISDRTRDFKDYLRDRRLKRYFDGASTQELTEREGLLERYVNESVEKYKTELGGLLRKTTTRGAMGVAILNDLYSLVSKAPFLNFSAFSYVLFGAKTIAEIPALYRYLKKSHDWYGALQWALMKPVDYILPVVGPAMEMGLFERIVKKRVLYEAERRFSEAMGKTPQKELMKQSLKRRISDIMDPVPINPGRGQIPAYAT